MNPLTAHETAATFATRVRAASIASLVATVLAGGSLDAFAQTRFVFVNGVRLSDGEIAAFDRRQCTTIPNGSYWLNPQTGAWGYAGNPQTQGVVGDGCRQQAGGSGALGRHGPYATLGRAQAEANRYRAQGFRADAFHNGDAYFVNVYR